MGRNEDYLDKLLNSVNDNEGTALGDGVGYLESEEDFINDFERELDNNSNDDFLRQFESELGGDPVINNSESDKNSGDDYLKNLDNIVDEANSENLSEDDELNIDTLTEKMGAGNDDILSMFENGDSSGGEDAENLDTFDDSQEEDEQMGLDELLEQMPNEDESDDLSSIAQILDEVSDGSESDFEIADNNSGVDSELPGDEDLDLPGEDMLGDEAEIGDELGMVLADDEAEEESSGKKKKKKKEKKPKKEKAEGENFFGKLAQMLFGEDEPEPTQEQLDAEKSEKEKKKQAKKEEKEQKAQEKKAAQEEKKKAAQEAKALKAQQNKEKKEAKAKIKAEKAAKNVDNSPPLPKVPVILITVMALSIGILIYFGSSVLGYMSTVSQAKSLYNDKDYKAAYTMLNGINVKEKDAEIYRKSALMSYLQAEYDGYNTYMAANKYEEALDCLIRGIGRYDLHIDEAAQYGIQAEYDELEKKMEEQLAGQFAVISDEARELYAIKRRRDYTRELKNILSKLNLE